MEDDYEYSMTDTTVEKSWTKQIEIMQLTIDGLIDRVVKLEEEVEALKSKQEKSRKSLKLINELKEINNKGTVSEMKEKLFVSKDGKVNFAVNEMMGFVNDLSEVVKVGDNGEIYLITKNKAKYHILKRIELMLFAKAIANKIDSKVSRLLSFEEVGLTFSQGSANGESPYYNDRWERYIKKNKYHLIIKGEKVGLKETSIKYYYDLLFPKD